MKKVISFLMALIMVSGSLVSLSIPTTVYAADTTFHGGLYFPNGKTSTNRQMVTYGSNTFSAYCTDANLSEYANIVKKILRNCRIFFIELKLTLVTIELRLNAIANL